MDIDGHLLFCSKEDDRLVLDLVDGDGSPVAVAVERPRRGMLGDLVESVLEEWATSSEHLSVRIADTSGHTKPRADMAHDGGTRISARVLTTAGLP